MPNHGSEVRPAGSEFAAGFGAIPVYAPGEMSPLGPDYDGTVGPDDDTAPLPVILPDQPPPAPVGSRSSHPSDDRVRGPFEPSERPQSQPAVGSRVPVVPAPSAPKAKMDQIKDLYLTAEAIGDDALAEYFQQVSERQRQLIREYFDQAVASRTDGQIPG
jgi:hypothetical protein